MVLGDFDNWGMSHELYLDLYQTWLYRNLADIFARHITCRGRNEVTFNSSLGYHGEGFSTWNWLPAFVEFGI